MSRPVGPKSTASDPDAVIRPVELSTPNHFSKKMNGLFTLYHLQISIPAQPLNGMVKILDGLEEDTKTKVDNVFRAIKETPKNSVTLRRVVEQMKDAMKESGVSDEIIHEFMASFHDLNVLIKTTGGIKQVLDNFESRLWLVMYINRTVRNLARALSVVLQSEGIRSFGVSLGVLNLVGALSETKDVIYSAWKVVEPGRTPEQRIGACWDVLKNSAYVIADIGIGLNALAKWIDKIPMVGTLSGISLYVIIAAYLSMLMKSVLDYVMSREVLDIIEKDSKGNLDYARFKQTYMDRINDLNQTNILLRTLIRICEPDILSVLNSLEEELEKQGVVTLPGAEVEGKLLTDEQNLKVRIALKGRVTDKMNNFPAVAVSQAVNALAIGMLVLCPPLSVLSIVNGNLFVGTSLLWIWNRHVDGKSKERFKGVIATSFS